MGCRGIGLMLGVTKGTLMKVVGLEDKLGESTGTLNAVSHGSMYRSEALWADATRTSTAD